jgi:hypothetical protein
MHPRPPRLGATTQHPLQPLGRNRLLDSLRGKDVRGFGGVVLNVRWVEHGYPSQTEVEMPCPYGF